MSTRQTAATLSTAVTAFEQAIAAGALIAATESLEIGNDVVVQGAGVVSNTGAHTLIGVAASVGDVFSTGTVDIRNGASVRGQVYTGAAALTGPGHATAVTNWVGSKVSLQLLEPVSGQVGPRIAPEPGSNNVAVTLQPGRYQGLYLKAGTKAILESGGVYEFGEVILDSGSKVEVDSTCGSPTLQVVSTTIFRGEIIDSSPTPSGVSLVHRGSQTVHIETPFVGSIVAPKAELILNSSTHKGQFVAKKLRIQANAVIVPMANSIGVACASTVPVQGEQRSCSEGVCCHERAPMTPTGALVQGCTMSEVGRCIVLGSQSDVLASDVSVQVLGSGGDDRLLGSAEADMLAGGQGDDSECAGGGNDSLFGGSGNDMLRGGAGDDFIAPGPGSDIVIAGDGNDTVALLDACEAASGSIIDFGTGSNVLLSPISPDELRASGVTLSGEFEWREVGDGCLSPCSGRPVCTTGQECEDRRATGGGLVCVDPLAAPKPGQSVEPWVGSDGDIRARLQAWEEAAASFVARSKGMPRQFGR